MGKNYFTAEIDDSDEEYERKNYSVIEFFADEALITHHTIYRKRAPYSNTQAYRESYTPYCVFALDSASLCRARRIARRFGAAQAIRFVKKNGKIVRSDCDN